MKRKWWVGVAVSALMLLMAAPALAHAVPSEVMLAVGGQNFSGTVYFDDHASRTYAPGEAYVALLGGSYQYDAGAKVVTVQKGGVTIRMTVGETKAVVNGETLELDVRAREADGILLLPVRFIAERLGFQVAWHQASRHVAVQ